MLCSEEANAEKRRRGQATKQMQKKQEANDARQRYKNRGTSALQRLVHAFRFCCIYLVKAL